MKILLIFIALLPSYCLAKDIIYDNYRFSIPDTYNIVKEYSITKGAVYVINENKKAILTVERMKKDTKFFPLKEYGRNTHREVFYDIFGNHPTENKAVLEMRNINNNIYDLQEFKSVIDSLDVK
ncbi:MAG: hypothetical protein V3U87_03365 [Methylococcaceae bacterium]